MRFLHTHILGCLMLAAAGGAFAENTWEADTDGYHRIAGIENFRGVTNTISANVVVRHGEDYTVRAKGDRRVLRQIHVDVRDGQLRIRIPWRPWTLFILRRYHEILVEVTTPELGSVHVTGSGNVEVEDAMLGDTIALRTTGSGSISARGNADVIEIGIKGSGDIDFDGVCDKATFTLSGSGELHTTLAAQSVVADITGSGDIVIDGSAEDLALKISGRAMFHGESFTADTADVRISGSGDALMAIERELKARLSGSGEVRLTGGSPEIEAKTTGSGRVVQEE